MAGSLFWLSDEAWKTLEPHLPHGKPGKPRVDDRTVISGILHVLKTGCRWRDVPPAYGPPTTIYNRYNRWSQRRIWQRIFEKMAAAGPVPDELSIDSSHVKAHRSAAGSKRGSSSLADDRGRPVAFALTRETSPTSPWPLPCLEPSPDQSGCWQTKLTTSTACANGSNKGRSKQSFHPPPHAGRPILWTARPTNAETSSNECSASSRTGDASQPDMTAMRKTISLVSPSQPS